MMKKRLFAGIALCLVGVATTLTACGGSTTVAASFAPNWYEDVSNIDAISGTNEKLVYSVSKTEGTAKKFSLSVSGGEYVCELKNGEYRGKAVYELKTSFSLQGEYAMNSDKKEFQDSIQTVVYFSTAKYSLRPLFSEKTVCSTTLTDENATTLDGLLTTFRYTLSTTYSDNTSKATVRMTQTNDQGTEETDEKTYSLQTTYPVVDNEELLYALRAMTPVSNAAYVAVFDPYTGKTQSVGFQLSSTSDDQKYTFAKGLYGESAAAEEHTVSVNHARFGISATLAGRQWTAQYIRSDGYRNVPVAYDRAMTYDLGTLQYRLTSAQFAAK